MQVVVVVGVDARDGGCDSGDWRGVKIGDYPNPDITSGSRMVGNG